VNWNKHHTTKLNANIMPGTKETDDLKNGMGVAEIEEKAPLVIQGNGVSILLARSESLHRKPVSASRQISNDVVDALPSNLSYTCWDLFYTLVSVITYVFDLVMDCAVAFYFYHLGVKHGVYHYWYCGLTITFILLPSLTMTGFSLRWYLMDADNTDLPPVPLWRWIIRVIVLMLQFAPILRYPCQQTCIFYWFAANIKWFVDACLSLSQLICVVYKICTGGYAETKD